MYSPEEQEGIDKIIAKIHEIAKVQVCAEDDMFDKGVKSIHAIRLIFFLKQEFPQIKDEINAAKLTKHRTPASVAKYVLTTLESCE